MFKTKSIICVNAIKNVLQKPLLFSDFFVIFKYHYYNQTTSERLFSVTSCCLHFHTTLLSTSHPTGSTYQVFCEDSNRNNLFEKTLCRPNNLNRKVLNVKSELYGLRRELTAMKEEMTSLKQTMSENKNNKGKSF